MKKIGVIDYYLDQYHFENYPTWIREASGGSMEIVYAWAKTEHEGGKTNAQCCAEQGILLLSSIGKRCPLPFSIPWRLLWLRR